MTAIAKRMQGITPFNFWTVFIVGLVVRVVVAIFAITNFDATSYETVAGILR